MNNDFDNVLRERMHRLADHAPSTVRSVEEIRVVASPGRAPRRRNRVGIFATIAIVAGGAGLTGLALQGAADGGAATPAQAVQQLADALQREDVLGMIDQLDPTEVPAVRAAFTSLDSDAKRTKLVDDQFQLDGVKGLDLYVEGLQLDTVQLAPDVAVVRATAGTFSASFDPNAFPLGDAIRQATADQPLVAGTTTADLSSGKVMAATVERNGRWYVSIGYTIAEYARQGADVPYPTEPALTSEGFDSPEAAATALYTRLIAFDVQGASATVAPGEGDAFLRYAPLWLPKVVSDAGQAKTDGWNLSISGLAFTATGDGTHRTLVPTAFVIDGTVPPLKTDTGGQTFDPALPTVIFTASGQYILLDAGTPVPATIDGLTPINDFPTSIGTFNSTDVGPSGAVRPIPTAAPTSNVPLPLHVERANGCTTWSGEGAKRFDAFASGLTGRYDTRPATDANGARTICDEPGDSFTILSVISALGASGSIDLPSIATSQVGDRWYVSPVGTAALAVAGVFSGPADGSSLFDSPFGIYGYHTTRQFLETQLQTYGTIPPACEPIVDSSSGTPKIIANPTISQVRACDDAESNRSDVPVLTVPAASVPVAETVPAETLVP